MKKIIKNILVNIILFILIFSNVFAKDNTFVPYKSALRYIHTNFFNGEEIYFLEEEQNMQGLSIIIKTKNSSLIVIDGGRKESANKLLNFIKNNGGVVKAWFITHPHNDHIGALNEILENHKEEILINRIYYNFASLNWYEEKEGKIFSNYVFSFLVNIMNYQWYINTKYNSIVCEIDNKIEKDNIINIDNVKIYALNNIYILPNDSINNSSIVYKVNINNVDMIVLGDISLEGGQLLLEENREKINSYICVLAHHGQNGVDREVYKYIRPTIVIWPTTKAIYENHSKYTSDITKKILEELKVEKQYFTFNGNFCLN